MIESYVFLFVSGGMRIEKTITHGRKDFEEKKKNVAGREKQEIRGGVLENLVEKARRTTNTGKTSTMTFRRIHDDKQGQGIFDEEGIECRDRGKQEDRTIHQRKHGVDHLTVSWKVQI